MTDMICICIHIHTYLSGLPVPWSACGVCASVCVCVRGIIKH